VLKNKKKYNTFTLKYSVINVNAFTLIETMISITLLIFIFTITSLVYFNFAKEYKYSLERNNIFSETNFLFETISKHIKNSDIDYQSYWRENTRIRQDISNNKISDIWISD
jgi:type II secretory pathway pseudopilin PulG